MTGPKILTLDIETSPHLADVWGLFNQNVSLSQLRASTRMLCFAAKWRHQRQVLFASEFHDGRDAMLKQAWSLFDEADIVVHYNGKRFDVPHIMREFVTEGYVPPAPFKQVDLLLVARSRFRFASNKLDHVAQQLGLGGKVKNSGHDLWVRCMAGEAKAWNEMRRYNKGDVVLTEQVYDRLLPWISGHPHAALYGSPPEGCPSCGSVDRTLQGFALTAVSKFQRYRCNECSTWYRGNRAVARVETRSAA